MDRKETIINSGCGIIITFQSYSELLTTFSGRSSERQRRKYDTIVGERLVHDMLCTLNYLTDFIRVLGFQCIHQFGAIVGHHRGIMTCSNRKTDKL